MHIAPKSSGVMTPGNHEPGWEPRARGEPSPEDGYATLFGPGGGSTVPEGFLDYAPPNAKAHLRHATRSHSRRSFEEAANGQVLIEGIPMDANAASDQTPLAALGLGRIT
jgi:hypothetical protein